MKPYILIAKGVKDIGKPHPKSYPYWNELIELLKDYDIRFITDMPLDNLERLIQNSLTVICVDSFIQHFSWYLGKKSIVLWGQSDPLIFGHELHINLLKDRKYLRKEQFQTWDNVELNNEAFVRPERIVEELRKMV